MKTKLILLLMGTGLILASCTKYPPSSDRLVEDLAIYTKYDQSVNFTTFKTFYMSDSLVYVSDEDSGWYYNSQVKSLTARIAENMTSRGYLRTWNAKTTDLYLGVSFIKNVNVTVYYPGWYWGYPGYYPPNYWGGGGYYYPYYPAYITSYSTGTILIDMMDVQHPTVDKRIPVRWNSYVRGLLTGDHTTEQIQQSIDQAFAQTKGFPPKH
ncbi:MAG: DUF4136 domain-containing protein [Bacteroidota bacterium]